MHPVCVMSWQLVSMLFIVAVPTDIIMTHVSVSYGSRKQDTRKLREYINRNNKVVIFTHS